MLFKEFNDPKWDVLASVKHPSRYAGCEWGDITPKEEADFRICLCFPDVYEVGMSYVGFQLLYPMIKKLDGIDVERAYCPWMDMEEALRQKGLPLDSIESDRPLSSFDAVGFTFQYELSFTNMLTMLDLGGIPLRNEDRGKDDPIVMAGGPGALVPEPMADFIDLFCLGDGEAMMPELLEVLRSNKGMDRADRIAEAVKIEGVYAPSLVSWEYSDAGARPLFSGHSFKRVISRDMDDICPESMIVPSASIVHDRVAVEVFRGCSRGCRFCQAGMIYRPVRERSPESVVENIRRLADQSGCNEVSLVSLASCDYSNIQKVIEDVRPFLDVNSMKLSLPSLRMDNFALSLAASLSVMKKSGLTLAPEAGTQRLRNVINKGVTEGNIEESLKTAFENGWERIKLYFMMGLPTETEEDLQGILDIANRAVAVGRSFKRKANVSVSVAGFVPKPHTPFQWEPQNTMEQFWQKGRWLKGKVRSRKISLSYHEPAQSFLEGVFARGDRRLGRAIQRAWEMGARFDGWSETFDLSIWLRAFDESGIDPDWYAHRARPETELFPWDHIDTGVSKEFLLREMARSREVVLTPDCRNGVCSACGWQDKGCNWLEGRK